MIYPKVVRGGNAIPIGENLFLMKGRKHKNGGIDIGKDLEVEGDEVMQTSPNEIKVFSAQKFLGGESPADLVLAGANPDRVFAAQERYKDEHKINDDGTKQKKRGGKVINWIKDKIVGNKKSNSSPVEGNDNSNGTINFDNLKLTNDRSYSPQYLSDIYNGLIQRGINKNQAITIVGTIAEESGGDVFAKSKDNKFTGLLQWEDRRYKIQYPEDRDKELNAQLDYIADTLTNAQQRKDNGFTDDWTDGGKGSGYNSWKDAYNDFNDYTNIYNMTRGLNTGYVRPIGGIKGNTGSITNRMNAARQIFENNGITDLQYEPKKQKFGGMSKNKKDTFMDSLMKSITDLDKVELGNRNNPQLNGVDAEILDNELNRDILLRYSPSTGKQIKACGGRKKALFGSDGKYYSDEESVPNGVYIMNRSLNVPEYKVGFSPTTPTIETPHLTKPELVQIPNSENNNSNENTNTDEDDILRGQNKVKRDHWLINGIGAGSQILSGVTGAIINNATNRKYLGQMEGLINKMKAYDIPLTKLKTHYNINPQLAEIDNALRIGKQDIDANTASSQVALARKRSAQLNATLEKNKLHGQKENIETDLINKDRLQQGQTIAENIRNHQNVENQKLQMLSEIVDKRAENATATTQNIVGAVQSGIGTLLNGANQYEQLLAGLAANPNGTNAIYGNIGKREREKKDNKNNKNKNT